MVAAESVTKEPFRSGAAPVTSKVDEVSAEWHEDDVQVAKGITYQQWN